MAKPLLAVCDMVDHGHAVLFDSGGSYAFNKKTGARIPFLRRGKEWEMKLTLEALEKANQVMAGLLAEMKEARAKTEEPEITLHVNGGGEVGVAGVGEVDAAMRSSFLSGRDEPLFRLAVHQ